VKTYKHLFAQVYAFDNLWSAFHQARKGKRSKGSVAAFEYRLERNLFELETALREGSYRPGGYHHFYIYEPKRRKISAAPFRDRVVHHALCNVIEPIFEQRFSANSFACRIAAKAPTARSIRPRAMRGATATYSRATSSSFFRAWITRCCEACWRAASPTNRCWR